MRDRLARGAEVGQAMLMTTTNKATETNSKTIKLVVSRPDAWGRYWDVTSFDAGGYRGRTAISTPGVTREEMAARIAKTTEACGWNVSEVEWAETRDAA